MKSFLDILKEEQENEKHHVIAFGRMNPPTTGHLKMIDRVKSIAQKNNASHTVIASHSQDSKKNPLSGEEKIKHLKRFSPGTNFKLSSKEHPTIMHAAAEAHARGVTHLHVVAGSDRVKEYHDLLHKYNGKKAGHGEYNFKKITVHSAGHRDPDAEGAEGMSATKMREHAKNKNFSSFREGVPHHVSDEHAKEMMHDVRKGMGLHEEYNRGMFKAIFVTGGPGSGKDVVIREAIPDTRATEISLTQAFDFLTDKQKLSEKSDNYKRESVRNRSLLVINGPADSSDELLYVKEELEELGYDTIMVFVDTTNETSQKRNTKLSRMMVESIRYDKWTQSQNNKKKYSDIFENFISFNNNSTIESLEEDITDTYKKINRFIESDGFNETAHSWLEVNMGLDINQEVNSLFKENKNDKRISSRDNIRSVQSRGQSFRSFRQGPAAKGPADVSPDNRPNDPNADNIKWDANKRPPGTYIFRTYEETDPIIKVYPEPKESNFSKDKEKIKRKGLVDAPTPNQRLRNVTGIGPEFDTRQQGTVYPMSGLGDVTYREQKEFKKFRKEAIDHHTVDMGVAGVMGGATNKELMDTYFDPTRNIGTISKKKKDKK
jgi:dephospho-CoA kinase